MPAGVIARIGDRQIDASDFGEAGRKVKGKEFSLGSLDFAAKRGLLDALIAQQLLVVEGLRRRLDRETDIQRQVTDLERQLLAKELYLREVEVKLSVTKEEISRQYEAWGAGTEILIGHIQCDTQESALEILQEIKEGSDFAALARQRSLHTPSAMQGGTMGYVRQSLVLPEFFAALWEWPIAELYPQPIQTSLGYHIVRVEGRRQRSIEQQRKALVRAVERQKRAAAMQALLEQLGHDFGLQWHPETMEAMARAGKTLSGDLVLCEWEGGRLSTADYVRRLTGQKVIASDAERIRQVAQRHVTEELAALEARHRGLDQDEDLRRQIDNKRGRLLGERLFELEVGEGGIEAEQLRAFYEQNKEKYRGASSVTVREILVENRALADSLFTLAQAGADMADLARRYTLRAELAEKGGLWENVNPGDPRTASIYRTALRGEGLQAVTKVPRGYSVFEVLDKQAGPILTYAEVADPVKADMEMIAMDRFIRSLKVRYQDEIQIDEAALRALQ
jgi:parvulin-like peptidyl-prolyl isomerase